ncbi:MAG: hypothetical protein LBI79_06875 [Nitrososphaerota archaeon]|jgi:hypothetical protein|nr:hypothetical protein [Nitrososphaerota archaeon]
MKTKKAAVLVLISLIVYLSVFTLATSAYAEQTVGVKEGDWMEYDITVTGTGSMPPTHDVRWMRMGVLVVDGAAFSVNVTARYANGTLGSAIWKFNFTEGNVEGWTIIPANLSPGDTFFDYYSKPTNVTIQREEQKTVLGATRAVTYGNDSIRQIKEWDKATGFFIGSVEVAQNHTDENGWYYDNLTVTCRAVATNIWGRQILGLEQSVFALVISGLVLGVVTLVSALIIWQREKMTTLSLRYPLLAKRAIPAVIIVGVVVLGATVIPAIWMDMGLSNAAVNLIMQSFWLSLILVSMGFRKTSKYFVHWFLIAAVVIATLVSFASVIMMWSPSDSALGGYISSPIKIAELVTHSVLSVPAIALGVWFIALWYPNTTAFPARSKRIVKLMVILWVLSYIAGVVGYILDYTTLLLVY